MSPRNLTVMLVGLVGLTTPVLGAEPVPTSIEQLRCMSWEELEKLYRQSGPGRIPNGYVRGKAIYNPCEARAKAKSRTTDLFWLGKHFCAANGTLVNQWAGVRAIRANVFEG